MKKTNLISLIMALCIMLPLVLAISDFDKDGIPDGNDKFPKDFDNDGMPDIWEKQFGLRFDSATDAKEDFDNDGISNLEEFNQNTNPTTSQIESDSEPESELFALSSVKFSNELILGTIIIVMIIVIIILIVRIIQKKKNKLPNLKSKKDELKLPEIHSIPKKLQEFSKDFPPLNRPVNNKINSVSNKNNNLNQNYVPLKIPEPTVPKKTIQSVQAKLEPNIKTQNIKSPQIQYNKVKQIKSTQEPVYQHLDQELDDAFKKLKKMKKKFEKETKQ